MHRRRSRLGISIEHPIGIDLGVAIDFTIGIDVNFSVGFGFKLAIDLAIRIGFKLSIRDVRLKPLPSKSSCRAFSGAADRRLSSRRSARISQASTTTGAFAQTTCC